MKRLLLALVVVLVSVVTLSSVAVAQSTPQFKLGFKALADQVPDVVGTPIENEHWGANGDSLQMTGKGLMAWRKADNWTAFTNGATTWINGPVGVQSRPNSERFEWERDAPPAAPTAAPAASRGIVSETPAGAWVTSSYLTAKNYYAASDPRWKELSPQYRVWFDTKEALLAQFPDRVQAP